MQKITWFIALYRGISCWKTMLLNRRQSVSWGTLSIFCATWYDFFCNWRVGIFQSIHQSICPSVCQFVYLSVSQSMLLRPKLPYLIHCFGKLQCHYSRLSGKTYAFLVPLKTCKTYVQKTLGQNNVCREGTSRKLPLHYLLHGVTASSMN